MTKPDLRDWPQLGTPYEWQDLPEDEAGSCWIRVLELEPGASYDELKCSFKLVQLGHDEDVFPYEAVSYCWGPETPLTRVYIGKSYTMARPNLVSALTHLRYPDRSRSLWVDALCINQENVDEKAVQVGQMARIYASATRVVSWLGPAAHDAEDAFALIQSIASKADKIDQLVVANGIYWQAALDMTLEDFQIILRFLCDPYFERLWVVQEVISAKAAILQRGHDVLSWMELAFCFFVFTRVYLPSGFPIHPNVDTTRLIMDLMMAEENENKLSFLLDRFSIRMAKHPADKIFGLIGLLSAQDRALMPRIQPDYRVDVRDLYMDATLYCIQQDHSLDLLSTCQPTNHSINNLPSWTPDWSFNYRNPSPTENIPRVNILRPNTSFHATAELGEDVHRRGSALVLSGYIIDELTYLGNAYTIAQQQQFVHANAMLQIFNSPTRYMLMWLAMKERAVQSRILAEWRILFDSHKKANWFSKSAPEEMYWMTITALDTVRLEKTRRINAHPAHVAQTYKSYKLLSTPVRIGVRLGLGITMLTLLEVLMAAIYYFLNMLGLFQWTSHDLPLHTYGRRMGGGKRYEFANVPEHTRSGDVVALIRGAKVPMILRRRGSQLYEIVGDAYIRGIMFGEAWDQGRCHEIQLV